MASDGYKNMSDRAEHLQKQIERLEAEVASVRRELSERVNIALAKARKAMRAAGLNEYEGEP